MNLIRIQKLHDEIYNVLSNQFAGDKGNKDASKEVGEEKRKEKEALRLEREREHELEEKRKQDEERARQEVIKAKASIIAPKQVGKIDLNPKAVEVAKPVVEEAPKEEELNQWLLRAPKEEVKPEVSRIAGTKN